MHADRRHTTMLVRSAAAAGALALQLAGARSVLAQGCAMCATYLGNGDDPRSEAFKASIVFLMSMPFVVAGSVGAWILWMHRRARPKRPELRVLQAEQEGAS